MKLPDLGQPWKIIVWLQVSLGNVLFDFGSASEELKFSSTAVMMQALLGHLVYVYISFKKVPCWSYTFGYLIVVGLCYLVDRRLQWDENSTIYMDYNQDIVIACISNVCVSSFKLIVLSFFYVMFMFMYINGVVCLFIQLY